MANDEGVPNDESDGSDIAFWDDDSAVVREDPAHPLRYDLEERTARFGEAVIAFAKTIPQSAVTTRLISQLGGCGTSVGANYCEADDAVSRKEFFLRMIVTAVPESKPRARELWREARELHLIFSKICRSR